MILLRFRFRFPHVGEMVEAIEVVEMTLEVIAELEVVQMALEGGGGVYSRYRSECRQLLVVDEYPRNRRRSNHPKVSF